MRMKKILFTCIALFFLLAGTAAYAEANYDSNGKAGFYGVYEYPKDEPPTKDDLPNSERDASASSDEGRRDVQSALPSYEGKGQILPRAGDRSSSGTTIAGIVLLAFIGLRLRRGGDFTEKNNHSPRW